MSKRAGKQKRQRENRQRREARAARSARAGEATAISRGEREPTHSGAETEATGNASGKTAGKTRRRRESPYKIPGQRAVVMAFMFSLVAAGTLLFAPIQVERDVAPDDPRIEESEDDVEENDDGTVTIVEDAKLLDEEGLGYGIAVMALPIAITGAAAAFTKRPQRSNAWTIAMVALSAYIFLFAGPYGVIALPSLIALAVGGFQSRRAENKERLAQIEADRAARAAAGEDGREVIDVDSVEDAEDAVEGAETDEAPSEDEDERSG